MGAETLTASDVRHYWANVNGQIVPGWQLAVQWDRQSTPTHWRTLNPDNPEDQRLLSDLVITWQAPGPDAA
jgi:hypothetical protein